MYHITKTKSLTQPYQVVNVDAGNGEVINTSELLTSKSACLTNIVAAMDTIHCENDDDLFVIVQDDTLKKPAAFTFYDTRKKVYNIDAVPKYIAGRSRKKKK